MKILAVVVLAVSAVVAGVWSPRAPLAAETYHLGVALGLTGTGAPYSREAVNAVRLAVDEINAEGGFLGRHPIAIFTENTRTEPAVAEAVVTRLIEREKVRAVIGTYSSATALAIKPICRANRVLHIATISNSEDITRLDPSPYTFSVVPNTYMISKAVAIAITKLAAENGWKNYVTIASDYAWGRSSQEVQVAMLKNFAPDLELNAEYWPPLGHVGFNAFIVAIINEKPDFVLASIAGADNARWDAAVRDYHLDSITAIPGGLISVTELINEANWLRRGTYGRTRAPFFAHMGVPMMASFVEQYWSRHGRYPSDWAVMAYDGVYALKQGIEKAGSIDTEQVKDAMKGASIRTTRGELFFREVDNQLSASAYFGRVGDDVAYEFPIYLDLQEFKGPDIWRPEAEILAARALSTGN
jgi:branched-chain amino acid transport system substrate-binding protein